MKKKREYRLTYTHDFECIHATGAMLCIMYTQRKQKGKQTPKYRIQQNIEKIQTVLLFTVWIFECGSNIIVDGVFSIKTDKIAQKSVFTRKYLCAHRRASSLYWYVWNNNAIHNKIAEQTKMEKKLLFVHFQNFLGEWKWPSNKHTKHF